ncbi:MAG TPA: hypothetical protein VN033_03865 [Vulgatibacter sp.]|nr:hypothetical protein [Vulgatibacter sp.]
MLRVHVVAAVCFTFFVGACGGASPDDVAPTGPEILLFEADPDRVAPGEASTLSWRTSGASRIEIFAGAEPIDLGSAGAPEGSVEVRPAEDTVYRLVAFAADGGKREASATVTVAPPEAPRILSFLAAPATVAQGESTVLSWTTEGADSVHLRAGTTPIDIGDAGVAEGEFEVTPLETTVYVLEALRGEVRATAEVVVDVLSPPAIEFEAAQALIDYGASTTLAWTVEGATRIVVSDGTATLFDGATASGSVEVSPTNRTTYTLTAEGLGGTSTAEAEVAVRPAIVMFDAPLLPGGPLPVGMEIDVSWFVNGAEELTLTNLEGFSHTTTQGQGSMAVPLAESGVLRLVAVREGAEAIAEIRIETVPPPTILSFEVTPAYSTRSDPPPMATVSWSVADAQAFSIEATPGGTVVAEGEGAETGSILVSLERDTTFRIRATRAAVEVSAEAVARVVEPPRIDSFRALPSRVGIGEEVELGWTTTDAAEVSLVQDGAVALPVDPASLSGTLALQLAADATFALRATNLAGDHDERIVSVGVGGPQILSFDANAQQYDPSDPILLEWANDGGRTLAVVGPDGAVPGCTTTDLEQIALGGCSLVAPSEGGTLSLELVVTNGVGQEARWALGVEVRAGARILSFTGQADKATVGDEIVLAWDVTTDAQGQPAVLTLEDDLGNTWPLGDKDPLQDTISIVPATAGIRTYTLTATSADQSPAIATVEVEVFDPPVIGLTTLDGAYDPSLGAPLMLSWVGTGVVEMSIYVADDEGEPVAPAIYEASAADLAAGTGLVDVYPVGPTEWVAVAANGAGKTVRANTSASFVALQPPIFEALPDEIVAGETSTLSWSTSGAAGVRILGAPVTFDVGPATDPFIDLSASTSAMVVPYGDMCDTSWEDEGCPIVAFPDGFSFPYFGVTYTSARVYVNGFISFDTSRTGESFEIEEVPNSLASFAHLAPFWSDLDSVAGAILYETGQDAKGAYLIFQWSHSTFAFASDDLNFQLVMWEDGDFDFRYQTMSSSPPQYGLGENGSIGYQNLDGTVGESITYMVAIPGLENSGYSFRAPALSASGTLVVEPTTTTTYELVAQGWDGTTQSATATVTVHQPVTVQAEAAPSTVDQGEPVTIHWTARNAIGITVNDANGPVYVADPTELEEGSVVVVPLALGQNLYTVVADGPMGTQAVSGVAVNVLEPFGLDLFEVADPEIPVGGVTSLSWVTHGADSFSLTENGVDVDLTGYVADVGTMPIAPTGTTTYTLTIERLDGRSFSETRTVRVIRVNLDLATLDQDRIAIGGQVNVSWSASSPSFDPVGVRVMPSAMVEVDATDPAHAFEDISSTGTELSSFVGQDGWGENVTFPSGFVFPYEGELVSAVVVQADGYLSLNLDQPTNFSNVRLPGGGSEGIAIAPFWDDLHAHSTGHVYTELVSDAQGDRFIIQWSGFQYWISGGSPPGANLNFQVALFPDGSFEYRYGAMASPTQDRADGSSATIGYQGRDGSMGHTLSFNTAMAGGLSNRTWRFEGSRPAAGTTTATPGRDGSVHVCATAPGDMDCVVLHVDVLAPGDLIFTELMLDPTGGPSDRWFEVRNLYAKPIDLEGLEIVSGADAHTISSGGPLVLQPGAYATLAAGATPGFTPDYVYAGVVLDPSAPGDLALRFGGLDLTKVAWNSSWNFVQGASASLDGAGQAPSVASSVLSADWFCDSTTPFGSGDFGSPGAAGAGCLTEYDVDFYASEPFIDISTTGTSLPNVFLNGSSSIPGGIPFSFPYFGGGQRNNVYVSITGMVYFAEFCFLGCFPDYSQGVIAVYGDYDLLEKPTSSVKYKLTTVDSRQVLIVQWTDMDRWSSTGSLTFQAQLWEGGDIVFVYPVLQGGLGFHGAMADVSLTAIGGSDLLEYSYQEPFLREGQSILFHYR